MERTGTFCAISRMEGGVSLETPPDLTSACAQVYEDPEILSLVLGHPHVPGSGWASAMELASRKRAKGDSFIQDVHGYFLILFSSKITGRCEIFLDRFGGYRIFVHQDESGLILSDSIFEVMQRLPSVTVRSDSLVEFINFGFIFGEKTLFQEIRRLCCALKVTLEENARLAVEEYWSPIPGPCDSEVDEETVREAFNAHIHECFSISRKVSLALTCGLDSRAILSACTGMKDRLRCFTLGDSFNTDVKIASSICEEIGIRHKAYPLSGDVIDSFHEDLEIQIVKTNGLINFILLTNHLQAFEQESKESDTLFFGIGPFIYRGYALKTLTGKVIEDTEILREGVLKLRVAKGGGILRGISDEDQVALVCETVLRAAHRDFPESLPSRLFPLWSEYLLARERISNYSTYFFASALDKARLWECWLYSPLIEMSLRVDRKKRINDVIPRYIISKNCPELSKYPSSKGSHAGIGRAPIPVFLRGLRIKGRTYYRKSANLLGRNLFRKEPVRPDYIPDYTLILTRGHPDFVRETLRHEKMFLAPLIDGKILGEKVELFLRGCMNLQRLITNIMSLEIFLEKAGSITGVRLEK